jgi:hypothetical protein
MRPEPPDNRQIFEGAKQPRRQAKEGPLLASKVHIEPPNNQASAQEYLNKEHLGRDLGEDEIVDQDSPLVKAHFRVGKHEQTTLLWRVAPDGSRIPVALALGEVVYDLTICQTLERDAWKKILKKASR